MAARGGHPCCTPAVCPLRDRGWRRCCCYCAFAPQLSSKAEAADQWLRPRHGKGSKVREAREKSRCSLAGTVGRGVGKLEHESLTSIIPGLPNAVALHCLARTPRGLFPVLKLVSRLWRDALSSEEIYGVRKEIGCTEPWIYLAFVPRSPCRSRARPWFEAYDPTEKIWRSICWMPGVRDSEMLKGFGCVGLNAKMYVIGGLLCTHKDALSSPEQTDLQIRKDVYVYDCMSNTWRVCASMSTARVDFACSVSNGKIFVAGGKSQANTEKGVASAEVYYPEEDRWQSLPKMNTCRYKCAGVTLDNRVCVIGGFTQWSENNDLNSRSSADVYDPVKNSWEFVRGMWQLDIPPYQIVNLEGQLYSSGDALNPWKGSIELYNEYLNMWTAVRGSQLKLRKDLETAGNSLPVRRYVTMAAIGKRLFVFAGHCLADRGWHSPACLDTVDIFSPIGCGIAGRWEALEPYDKSCNDLCSHCCVVEA